MQFICFHKKRDEFEMNPLSNLILVIQTVVL